MTHSIGIRKLILAATLGLLAQGCATTGSRFGGNVITDTFANEDPCSNNARNTGILIGSVIGAVIGNQVTHSNTSRLVGAGTGALIGGLIGSDMDSRRCALAKIALKNKIDLTSTVIYAEKPNATGAQKAQTDTPLGLQVHVTDGGTQFKPSSEDLTDNAKKYFTEIADQYSYTQQMLLLPKTATAQDKAAVSALQSKRVLLVGNTDDMGVSEKNADLSERRAKTVAKLFQERGVPESQIFYQGAGETQPVADNRTDAGRDKNRRVDVIDLSNEDTFKQFLSQRAPATTFYRNAPVMTAVSNADVTPAKKPVIAKSTKPKAIPKSPASTVASDAASAQISASPATSKGVVVKQKPSQLDFGGEAVVGSVKAVDIGPPLSSSSIAIVSNAMAADDPMIGACYLDHARVSGSVKSLKTGQAYDTSEFMPGLYGTSWAATVNNNLVAITHVAVLRDGGLPTQHPTLLIYKDYQAEASATALPTINELMDVNVYRGTKGLLYRAFSTSQVNCFDVVIAYSNHSEAQGSSMYYKQGTQTFRADINPKIAK